MRSLIFAVLVGFASAAWQNCDRPVIKTVQTNGKDYDRMDNIDLKAREPAFVFSYKGCKNARLRFTETANSLSRGFNINIDVRSSGNPETYINFRYGYNDKWKRMFTLRVGRKVVCDEFRDFWVSWDYDMRKIAIGAGKNPNLEEWGSQIIPEDQLTDVRYVHISSGRQNAATWKLYKQCNSIEPVNSCGSEDTACTECKGTLAKSFKNNANSNYVTLYDLVDMVEKEPAVVVGIKSCKGIRMRFLEEQNIDGLGYNANIDVNSPKRGDLPNEFWVRLNYRTGALTGEKYITTKEFTTPQKLRCDVYSYFWVKWNYDTGIFSLGEGRDPTQGEIAYSMMTDFRKLNIRYMAVDSQGDNVADWKIYHQCDLPSVEPECSKDSDCDENHQCKDGKCVECPEGTKLDLGECKTACAHDEECPSGHACDAGTNVCNECPAGTAPRLGYCDEICSASDKCTDPKHACIDGFCDPCGEYEIVDGDSCLSICELKKNEDCSNKVKRYFYKPGQEICVEFQGCAEELTNSFASKPDCSNVCSPKKIPPECLLETDAGTCEDYQRRYYYDKVLMACKKFEYNGCEGNENNFLSKEACRLHCAKYD